MSIVRVTQTSPDNLKGAPKHSPEKLNIGFSFFFFFLLGSFIVPTGVYRHHGSDEARHMLGPRPEWVAVVTCSPGASGSGAASASPVTAGTQSGCAGTQPLLDVKVLVSPRTTRACPGSETGWAQWCWHLPWKQWLVFSSEAGSAVYAGLRIHSRSTFL